MNKVVIVCGAQMGSEGKGHIAHFLLSSMTKAARITGKQLPLIIRIGGPNAGHTVYDSNGIAWPLRTIPIGAVIPGVRLGIAAGSEIDLEVLDKEINDLEAAGHDVRSRLYIDSQATVLDQTHKEAEKQANLSGLIGSTSKGIGAARAARIMRQADIYGQKLQFSSDMSSVIDRHINSGGDIMIETSQGYGLGLHAGFYPFCTSADCRPIDALAAVGISPWDPRLTIDPWLVCRTLPIRVAGNSGPLKDEVTWEQLAAESGGYIKPEKTTVTKKIRRIGRWDAELVKNAIKAAGGVGYVRLALTFVDYLDPEMSGVTNTMTDVARKAIAKIEKSIDTGFEIFTTSATSVIDARGLRG